MPRRLKDKHYSFMCSVCRESVEIDACCERSALSRLSALGWGTRPCRSLYLCPECSERIDIAEEDMNQEE